MDKSNIPAFSSAAEIEPRKPSPTEELLGLWVEHTGESIRDTKADHLPAMKQYSLTSVLAGEGCYFSPTCGEVTVNSGECMLHFPNHPSFCYPKGEWHICWISWNGPEADILASEGFFSPERPILPDPGFCVNQACQKLSRHGIQQDKNGALKRKAIMLALISNLYESSINRKHNKTSNPLMEEAVRYIRKNYCKNLRVSSLAKKFCVSLTHFRRLFRQYVDTSPSEFINNLRMAEARQLLREGLAIKQVAALTGYNDIFYFMRSFKKSTGISPGAFSKTHLTEDMGEPA